MSQKNKFFLAYLSMVRSTSKKVLGSKNLEWALQFLNLKAHLNLLQSGIHQKENPESKIIVLDHLI